MKTEKELVEQKVGFPTMSVEVLKGLACLRAVYANTAQPKTRVFFYYGTPEQWSLTYEQVQIIYAQRQVWITSKSNKETRGLFTIGGNKKWYYSHSLFPNPQDLEDKIYELLKFALTGDRE